MTRRNERVREAIRRLASEAVHSRLRDPRIKGFITITKVEVTADLRLANIYYSVLGDDKKKRLVAAGLKSAKSFIRGFITNELKLRYATNILFRIDESAERRQRIDTILNKLHEEGENGSTTESNRSN